MKQEGQSGTRYHKLVVCIVHQDDADRLRTALLEADFASTVMSSTGGFLRQGNVTLLVGTDGSRLAHLFSVIRQASHSRTEALSPPQEGSLTVGAAIVFVLDVERYHRL